MRIFTLIFMLLFVNLLYPLESGGGKQGMMPIEEIARKKLHHGKDGRFLNPWCPNCRKSYIDLLRWMVFSRNVYKEEKRKETKFNITTPDISRLNKMSRDYALWLGHSTVFMRIGSKTIITDPIFWDINFFLKRKTHLPIDPKDLPKIDYVLISHGHYDHLDTKSIKFLKEHFNPSFISGPGYKDYFTSIGISKQIILDWWEGYDIENIRITSLPVQHWSKRGLFDTDKMLWCSFLIEHNNKKYYWIADSGYYEGYKEIGNKFGPIDVLFAPVGSYEPRWFMKTYHVNPEEAIQVAKDVRAKNFIPTHWGTFDLTDEPLWLPIKHLKEIYRDESNPRITIIEHGGHFILE